MAIRDITAADSHKQEVEMNALRLSHHAFDRLYEERTVLSKEDILEILEFKEYVRLAETDDTIFELFYSPEDKKWYVLPWAIDGMVIKTILPLHMYPLKVPGAVLHTAKELVMPDIYVAAELVRRKSNKRKKKIFKVHLGRFFPTARVRSLLEWVTHPTVKKEIQERLVPQLSERVGCTGIWLRKGKNKDAPEEYLPWKPTPD